MSMSQHKHEDESNQQEPISEHSEVFLTNYKDNELMFSDMVIQ